jgi:hypothetical protein
MMRVHPGRGSSPVYGGGGALSAPEGAVGSAPSTMPCMVPLPRNAGEDQLFGFIEYGDGHA